MAAVKSFSTAAGNDETIVGENVDDADDESCADVKFCADVKSYADVKSCADEPGDESAVLENPVGIANDWLGDDNVPLAPPLLPGSSTDHGST